jgi:enoyl-CoA hydratase
MQETFETITLSRPIDHVLVVTLDRPNAANSLNTQMGFDLRQLWMDLYHDAGDLRCIVLTGQGDRIFCAGGDLKERDNMSAETWQKQHALFEQLARAMMECPLPIIGAINGAAFGGGTELALCCDFLYAAEHARFALPEVTLGIMPGFAGTQNMPRAVGVRRAKEFILTGVPATAAEAHEWGLVNKVCPGDKLMEEALATAGRIANNAPIATRQAKKSINLGTQVDIKTGYEFEIEAYNRMVSTDDRVEGIRAFNEKRKAEFKGR